MNLLFEVTVLNGSVPVTLRMAHKSANADGCLLNDYQWKPLITKRHSTSGSWSEDGIFAQGSINHTSLTFYMSSAYENEEWSAYEWNGGLARIFVQTGDIDVFSSYKQVFEGSVSALERQGVYATVALLGPDELLNRDLLTLEYAGSGGAEGPASLKGKFKPFVIGSCVSVDPILIDPAKWIYQVHGYGAVSSIKAYEYAQSLGNSKSDAANYAALASMTLNPGEWATCLAQGMFRLGATPSQRVSADVVPTTNQYVGDIIRDLLIQAGISVSKIGAMNIPFNGTWSSYVTEQVQLGDLARQAAYHGGALLFADGKGVWRTMNYYAPKTAVSLNADRSTSPIVKTYRELNAAPPVWKAKVAADPCWGVHSSNEISPALLESADGKNALAAAAAAQETANQAAADFVIAKQRIDAIDEDGKLDRSEKADVSRRFGDATAERTKLLNQGTDFNVTTERTAYSDAYDALKAYLEGLSPAYDDTATVTAIDRTTFNARWAAFYVARTNLLQAMTGKAGTTAVWASVSGTGKPADNATVGAPAGTKVADTDAATLVSTANDAKSKADTATTNIATQTSRVDDILTAKLPAIDKAITDNLATSRSELSAAKTSLNTDIASAKAEGTQAKADAKKASDDLAAEVTRAKGAEGAITTSVTNLKTTVDGHTTTISDNYTTLTNKDTALANRATALETSSRGAGNLLGNTEFTSTVGWTVTHNGAGLNPLSTSTGEYWNPPGERVLRLGRSGATPAGSFTEVLSDPFTVANGSWLQFYGYTANHRCRAWVALFFYDVNGNDAGYTDELYSARVNAGGPDLNGWDITGKKAFKVPTNARSARFGWRIYDNADSNPDAWLFHPYVGAAKEGQTEWNPYSPGSGKQVAQENTARIATEETTRANADSALATRATNLEATVNSGTDGNAALKARIATEETARANGDSAIATRTSTLETQYNGAAKLFQNDYFDNGVEGWTGLPANQIVASSAGRRNVFRTLPSQKLNGVEGRAVSVSRVDQKFKLKLGFRCAAASATYYFGAVFYNENGALVGASDGTGNYPLGSGFGVDSVTNSGWIDREVVIGKNGVPASPYGGTSPIPAGAVYFRPVMYINYNDVANSVTEIDYFAVEEVTSVEAANARITAEETARANGDSALATRASNLETTVFNGPNQNTTLASRITNEETARTNADSALATRASTLETNFSRIPEIWRVRARGNGAPAPANFGDNGVFAPNGAQSGGYSRSYTVVYFKEGVNSVEGVRAFDVYNNGEVQYNAGGAAGNNAQAMANYLNAIPAGRTVIVYTSDEPMTLRFGPSDVLLNAMRRCGSGEMYESNRFRSHSAYILIGKADAGRGNGSEYYAGKQDVDPQAYLEVPFMMLNGHAAVGDQAAAAATSARLSEEETARANADSALVTRATTLESQMGGNAASGLQTLIKNNRKNLADVSWWKKGASIPWPLNAGQRNEIVQFPHGPNFGGLAMPDGSTGDAWLCQAGADQPAGGWNSGVIAPLDPDKTYRFSVPIAALDPVGARQSYWGTANVCDLNTTNANGNPYFANGSLPVGRWYLFVGFIFPRNSTDRTHDGAGVYDMLTGEKIIGGLNFCFHPDGYQPVHRAYQFYATNGAYQAFGRPMVELIDGTETPIGQAMAASRTINARIATEETTRANADSALSSRTSSVEATVSGATGSSLTANANFSYWTDPNGLPNNWVWWVANGTVTRFASGNASRGYTFRHNIPAGVEGGIYQYTTRIHPGWYVMEADIELLDGSLQGAGITLSGVYNFNFASEPDVNGDVGAGGFRRRRFSKLVKVTQTVDNFHPMTSWSGFGSMAYKYVDWYYAGIRPATDGEIRAQKAEDLLGGIRSSDIQARIATEETARANADSAIASRTAIVESSISKNGFLNRNATFSEQWDGNGLPPGWSVWSQDGAGYYGRWPSGNGLYGSNAFQWDRNGVNSGFWQQVNGQFPKGWYVLDCEVRLEDGTTNGAGFHANFMNGYSGEVNFATEQDGLETTGNRANGNYKFTKLIYNGNNSTQINLHPMPGWGGLAGYNGFLRTIWFKAGIRAATLSEVKSGKVEDLRARVTTTEQTLAAAGNLAARWKISAQTPGANAFITAEALTSNGVAVSNVSIGGTAINLINTDGSGMRKGLTVENGVVTVYGALRAGASITLGSGTGWPVALASKDFSVSNGEYVSFGTTLDSLPNLTFAGNGLVALNSGETYRLYAENLTRDGFTARLEISVPAQPTNYDRQSGQYNGSGLRVIDKNGNDSSNNAYNVTVTGYITATAYNNGDTYCIWTEAYTYTGKQGYELQQGDLLMVMEDDGSYAPAPIEEIALNREHCITLRSASGIELTVSRSTPVTLRDGTSIKATAVQGHELPVLDGDDFRWEEIVSVEDAGERPVARIYVGDKTFAAGNEMGRSIFTHNAPVNKN